MKKIFKIVGVVLLAIVAFVIAAPFFFQDQIAQILKDKLNASLNAQIEFGDVDLSFVRAFPDARLDIKNISIINKAPFAGDTLFYAREVKLDMPLFDVFHDASEPIAINELIVNQAIARLQVNENNEASWDIAFAKAEQPQPPQDTTAGFNFNLKHYEINESDFLYKDLVTKNKLLLKNMNHEGNGDFSLETSTTETMTTALVVYELDNIEYLSGQAVQLDANILMELEDQKFTFQDNKALVNDLELELAGYVDIEEDFNMVDLTFKTPSSDFKNFFAVIPEEYRSNLDGITTTGDFTVNGFVRGEVDENRIPKMNISIKSSNASFQYPDLPQKVTNIYIDAQLKNETGNVDDTYVSVSNTSFNIGADRLQGSAMIRNLTSNMNVDVNASGNLNLGRLSQSFPLPEDLDLDGQLALDMAAQFDMESIEKERYERIKTQGTATLTDFKYIGAAFENPFLIRLAAVDLNTSTIKLQAFEALTGNTDINATGTVNNLVGFLIQDQGLKGNFNLKSKTFDVSDFMEETTQVNTANQTSTATTQEAVKIPAFLDANLDFAINEVLYDGLTLSNVSGVAIIRDETIMMNNVRTDIFGGNIGIDGSVSTRSEQPVFDMNLNMKDLDIAQSFQGFEMFQKFVPVIQALEGKINTDIQIKGNLTNELSPILTSIEGGAFAQLLTKELKPGTVALLDRLDDKLSFISLKDIDIRELATNLKFQDGAVQVSPFDFKVKDIIVTASGRHSLTNEMDYVLNLNVPAKYFGQDGAKLLAQLEDNEIENIAVPLPVKLGGSISNPSVNVDIQAAVTNLTDQIVAIQKQKLKDKGEAALGTAVDDIIKGKNPLDNVKDVLKGKKPQSVDTTITNKPIDSVKVVEPARDQVKNAAGNLLRNLMKKKVDTVRS